MTRYWRARQIGRGSSPEEGASLAKATPWPMMDKDLVKTGVKLGGRQIFRSKLWWDHLPSQQVRARGKGTSEAPADPSCELCGEPGEGSTWHTLSACPHPQLVGGETTGREVATK